MVDKQSVILIIFISMMILIAGIIVTGLVPEIFRQGEKIDQQLLLEHEDKAFEKQSISENLARDKQRYDIVNDTNRAILEQSEELKQYILESENKSARGAAERQSILENIQEVSNQHDKVSRDHDKIQGGIGNVTNDTNNDLSQYSENSISKLDNITKEIQELKKMLLNKSS